MKSRLAVGLLLGCLVAAAGCSSSSSSTASPATTTASPATTTATPTPARTAQNFQVSTPSGQVSLSLDGKLPPSWPSEFPVPSGAKVAGSGSLGGSSSATLVAAYTTSESAPDAFTFYKDNSKLTAWGQKSVGAGAQVRRTGEDHRTLHGLCHRGLAQRHHLHRHRTDELSSFSFRFRFPYRQPPPPRLGRAKYRATNGADIAIARMSSRVSSRSGCTAISSLFTGRTALPCLATGDEHSLSCAKCDTSQARWRALLRGRVSRLDRAFLAGVARRAPGGPPKAEPGRWRRARRRAAAPLDQIRLNSATHLQV